MGAALLLPFFGVEVLPALQLPLGASILEIFPNGLGLLFLKNSILEYSLLESAAFEKSFAIASLFTLLSSLLRWLARSPARRSLAGGRT